MRDRQNHAISKIHERQGKMHLPDHTYENMMLAWLSAFTYIHGLLVCSKNNRNNILVTESGTSQTVGLDDVKVSR